MPGISSSSFNQGGRNAERYIPPVQDYNHQNSRPAFDKPDPNSVTTDKIPFLDQYPALNDNSTSSQWSKAKDPVAALLQQLKQSMQTAYLPIKNLLTIVTTTTDDAKKNELTTLLYSICKRVNAYPIQGLLLQFISSLLKNKQTDAALRCIYQLLKINYFIITTLEKKLLYEECAPYMYTVHSLTVLARKTIRHSQDNIMAKQILYVLLALKVNSKSFEFKPTDLTFIYSLIPLIQKSSRFRKKRYKTKLTQLIQCYHTDDTPPSSVFKRLAHFIRSLFTRQKEPSITELLKARIQAL